MKMKAVIILGIIFVGYLQDCQGQENAGMRLPPSIRECYRDPELYSRDKRLPMTMKTLIELIRKVELYPGSYFSVRGLTIALLHRFRMDGIERIPDVPESPGVVPFRPTGIQFPKHRILLRDLIPGNAYTFPNESLTAQELCTLHFMLSSGVEPWERGNEGEVCPYNLHDVRSGFSRNSWHFKRTLIRDPDYPLITIQGAQLSRCPIEDGVVFTPHGGTVSPGIVLAGIAAALQYTQVQITSLLSEPEQRNDTDKGEKFDFYQSLPLSALLDNIWASTLAGDLAEIAVFQGPRIQGEMYIGPAGEWNDTVVPRIYYMDQRNHGLWQMTDAEARGGIDGLILANAVESWEEEMNSVKLSQILDMYYSDHGVSFNPEYRACERQSRLSDILSDTNFLESQTVNLARVLSYTSVDSVQISDEKLEEFSQKAVQAYSSHLSNLMKGFYCGSSMSNPQVHLNIVVDGSWTTDDAIRLLAQISEDCDVSHYGSSWAIMNGEDASWILEETHSASALFRLRNSTDNSSMVTWPRSLKLKLALGTLYSYLANKSMEERRMSEIGGMSHVVLVLAYSATISDADFVESTDIITKFKVNNPDVRFVYLASEVNRYRFEELSKVGPHFTDIVISVSDKSVETVVPKIADIISKVPSRLMADYCDGGDIVESRKKLFEDYITPGYPSVYRIHPQFFLDTAKISLHLQGNGYGDLSACISSEESGPVIECRDLRDTDEISFEVTSPCLNSLQCPPLFLIVSVTSSSMRCSEDDCRYPDQVRFTLQHEGLRCATDPDVEENFNAATRSHLTFTVLVQEVVIILLVTLSFRLF